MRTHLARHNSSGHCLSGRLIAVKFIHELLADNDLARAQGRPLLTEAGVAFLQFKMADLSAGHTGPDSGVSVGPRPEGILPFPYWDSDARQLRLGNVVLKAFRQPAPHQTMLLEVFQEQGWEKPHLEDPLPREFGESEDDARRRLHATIQNFNRSMPPGTIRFRGDGTGQGVIWEYVADELLRVNPKLA